MQSKAWTRAEKLFQQLKNQGAKLSSVDYNLGIIALKGNDSINAQKHLQSALEKK